MVSRRVALMGLTALAGTTLAEFGIAGAATQQPVPLVLSDKVADRFAPSHPANVRLQGWLGERMQKNARQRLLAKKESDLLSGFQQRPGKQARIGEHAGQW